MPSTKTKEVASHRGRRLRLTPPSFSHKEGTDQNERSRYFYPAAAMPGLA
jgi:hypothetical protein